MHGINKICNINSFFPNNGLHVIVFTSPIPTDNIFRKISIWYPYIPYKLVKICFWFSAILVWLFFKHFLILVAILVSKFLNKKLMHLSFLMRFWKKVNMNSWAPIRFCYFSVILLLKSVTKNQRKNFQLLKTCQALHHF